jgi:ferric iron reductase protein FhuF
LNPFDKRIGVIGKEERSVSEIDFEQLEKQFSITTTQKENPLFSLTARELLNAEKMALLVQIYAPLMKAKELPAVATYFASWFGGVALGLQYMMSVWNHSVDFSLDHLTIELEVNEGREGFTFVCNKKHVQQAPTSDTERAIWREQQLRKFYSGTVAPLFRALADATGIECGSIWGQLPTRFNYYMDIFIASTEDNAAKQRLTEDYRFLSREMDPAAFGRPKNPFDVKIRWIEDARDPEKKVRMKNMCCLYYQTEGGFYCYTCPRMKEAERAERRVSMRNGS